MNNKGSRVDFMKENGYIFGDKGEIGFEGANGSGFTALDEAGKSKLLLDYGKSQESSGLGNLITAEDVNTTINALRFGAEYEDRPLKRKIMHLKADSMDENLIAAREERQATKDYRAAMRMA